MIDKREWRCDRERGDGCVTRFARDSCLFSTETERAVSRDGVREPRLKESP